MSSKFNCSYMERSSLTYIAGISEKFFFQPIKFLSFVTAAILNGGRSEQKVTTLDKDLARNISAMYGSNPSSGS
jgi:pterin-4a-carbinolamine dehydratase